MESKKNGADKPIFRARISSVQFSGSVVSDSLRPHESQHARLWAGISITRARIETQIQSGHVDMGGKERVGQIGRSGLTYIHYCVTYISA